MAVPAWLNGLAPVRFIGMPWIRRMRSVRATTAPLGPGERLLLVLEGHSLVAATDRAIYHQHHTDPGWSRLAWHLVDQVRWNAEARTLTLLAPRAKQRHLAVRMRSSSPQNSRVLSGSTRALIDLVHERINSTILISHRTRIDDAAVLIVARRRSGTTAVDWVVTHPESNRAAASPARITAVISELRTQTGL